MLLENHGKQFDHCPLIPKRFLGFDSQEDVFALKIWLLESDLSPELYGPFPNYLSLFLWLARKRDII